MSDRAALVAHLASIEQSLLALGSPKLPSFRTGMAAVQAMKAALSTPPSEREAVRCYAYECSTGDCVVHDEPTDWVECVGARCPVSGQIVEFRPEPPKPPSQLPEREAVRVLEEAARRFLVGYAREVAARTQWATQSDPHTEESRRMFDTVMNREAETRDLAMALGRIVYPEETAALRAEGEGGQ